MEQLTAAASTALHTDSLSESGHSMSSQFTRAQLGNDFTPTKQRELQSTQNRYLAAIDETKNALFEVNRSQLAEYRSITVAMLAGAFFSLAGVVWLLTESSIRMSRSIAEIELWNSTRLDEALKTQKHQSQLAKEIFTSRRAEEELRTALADVWTVAAKMGKNTAIEPTSLKAAIPMTPRSNVSSRIG